MNQFKEKVLREIIKLGRKNRRWKTPALMVAAVFLVIYHMVRSFFLQFRYHPFRQRLIAGLMIIVLLFGQIEVFSVFADSESREVSVISSFTALPDEVREQTVPMGTAREELTLPGTLEAAVIMPVENNPESGEESAEKSTEEAENQAESTGEAENQAESTGEAENQAESTGEAEIPAESTEETESTPESGEEMKPTSENTEDNTGNPGNDDLQAGDSSGEENPEQGIENARQEENEATVQGSMEPETAGESGSAEESAGVKDEGGEDAQSGEAATEEASVTESAADDSYGVSAPSDETYTGEIKTETYTGVLPECQAENVITVETLGNTAEDITENAAENATENAAENATENAAENATEDAAENATGDAAEDTTEYTAEDTKEDAAEDTTEDAAENATEDTAENALEQEIQTETVAIEGVTWQSVPEYDKDAEGTYYFTAVLPEGYELMDGVSLPQITVTVQGSVDGGAVELLMRPYDEETSSDTVYYLADDYESYSWEIWNGWEWETLEYFEPELVVGKEEWYAYRFRCIVIKDGVRYTANAADDWQIEDFGIMLMAENALSAANSADSGQSEYMFYDNAWSSYYFNVKGMDSDTVIQTTYSDRGYRTASEVTDGGKVDWNSGGETAMGNSLYGTREISLVYNGRYAKITYTVENRGSEVQSFKVGSSADVMVGNNDYAPVVGSANGLTMTGSPKNNYTFNLVAPTASTLWYGYYGKAYSNMFTGLEDRNTAYTGDSGMAWSWSDSVAPGQTWSRYVLVGVGELPASPNKPTLTNSGSIVLQPGTATTITGTADAGSTVIMEMGGEEYSGQTDEDGNFSVTINTPADMPDGDTKINYYAVSSDGGISDVETITATVVSAPFITLTDSAVSVMEDSELDEDWYKVFIKTSGGTVSHTNLNTGTPGEYTVTYTAARDGYDNAAADLTVTVLPQPLELSATTASQVSGKDSFTLSATLKYTGGETISETGFVWGVMQNPTVAMNNGKKTTPSTVNTKNGSLSVEAANIAEGVTYYARAYAKTADGIIIYGNQSSGFGLGVPSYGTFQIVNGSGSTFLIQRTDTNNSFDGEQTVYYRTVNGSAVGGTHFKHTYGSVTFDDGDSVDKEVAVTEYAVTNTYGGKAATAYSNANRTYSVEIYRVDGGGTLGSATSATRSMTLNDNYKVDRNCYVAQKVAVGNSNKQVTNNGVTSLSYAEAFTMNRFYTPYVPYLKETAYRYEMHMHAYVGEYEDCVEWLRFTSGDETAVVKFGITPDDDKWTDGWFPQAANTTENGIKTSSVSGVTSYTSTANIGYVFGFDINSSSIKVEVAATGNDKNDWELGGCEQESVYSDIKEPQLLGIAPMAGGTYKAGDEITISLIFDEIVDSTNSVGSGLSNTSKITTTWGTFTYVGGADTNVLYFTGTVSSDADATGTISLKTLDCANQIKDMCNNEENTSTISSGSGETTAKVDNTVPTVSITNTSIANQTAKATISGANISSLKYTWSTSSTMPAAGWLPGTNGQTVNTRQTSGTWYLHVLGTYNATGKTAHAYTSFNFGSDGSGSGGGSMPELTLSADNSQWARSRTIALTKTPSTATVTVKTPSGTTAEVRGTSYTAEENGSYTFTLTAGDETVVKTITVSKIDKTAPEAVITGPSSTMQNEKVKLTVTPTDAGGSGVKTVSGKWTQTTNNEITTTETATLTTNRDGTYSATTPRTAGNICTYQLTVTVTDNAGNTSDAVSKTYTVNLKEPAITVTKQGEQSGQGGSNKGDTYSYEVTANDNEITAIQLPDGTITTDLTGTFTLTAPGTYYVIVSDAAGHVVRSSAMTVEAGVDGDEPEVRLYQPNEDWTNGAVGLDVSIYEEGSIDSAVWKKEGDASSKELSYSASKIENFVYSGAFSVTENGTYTVTATDGRGNVGTASITVSNIDKTAPVIGTLQYRNEPKNLWQWLIGKESLMITVPVTEEGGSGADEIIYTVTPESGSAENKTASIREGVAEITLSPDFKGEVSITCTDKAGNTSSSVTVGESGKGIILEANAPEITFGQYTYDSGITVTVTDNIKDDQKGAVSTGLNSVIYQIGGSEEVSVQGDFADSLKTGVEFQIGPEQITTGGVDILVKAVDNAGNRAEKTVTIEKHTVTYDYGTNGGTSATKTSDVILTDGGIDLTPKATREGWEFAGWNTDKDAETGLSSLTMGTKDVTLYAIYKKTLTLTCYSGSAGDTQTNTVTLYNNATEGSLTVPTAKAWGVSDERYDFYGYVASPDAFTGTVYGGDSAFSMSEDVTLYAIYRKAIQISYDANGGNGSLAGQTVFQSANVAGSVTYQADSFTLPEGTGFDRTGYNFSGWIAGSGTGTAIAAGTPVTPTGDTTYYAGWIEADYAVTLHTNGGSGGKGLTSYTYGTGAALPADWTKTGYTFGGWYDNEECTGTAVTEISATATGNREYWAKWVDDIAPAIGTLTYSYEPKNLWQWLFGKESLMITVPVTEEGSGADEIICTVTPESGSAENKASRIEDGSAKITVSADFKGTIAITCTDKAGNTSSSVTVGAGMGAAGITIEDNAPEISFQVNGSAPAGEYPAAPEITMTVTDDRENAISAGLASVTYQIGDGAETNVQQDFADSMKNGVSFTIAADQIPAGNVEIIVKATDNAGNRTEQKLTIHIHSGTFVEAKAATCTEDGHTAHYSCICGKRFSDSGCTKEVTAQEVAIPATGHAEVTDEAKAAACTETGLTEGSHCSVCGVTLEKQKTTDALGHDYSGSYRYDEEGHWKACSRCGLENTKHSHVYDNGWDVTCNDCGCERAVKNPDAEESEKSESETPKPIESSKPSPTTSSSETPGKVDLLKTPGKADLPETLGKADLPETPKPVEPSEDKPETTPDTQDDRQPEKEGVQTIPAAADNGRMTISGEPVVTGNVKGMTDTSTALNLGDGAVIVTVVCEEQAYSAGVADTVAVANAVLTPEQIQLVADGETIEIRIDVKDISGNVPEQDKDVIENGIEEYQKELPGLTLGMYVDISMFIKIGAGGWNAVTKAEEPIEVVIGIPRELRSDNMENSREFSRAFYIIRSHEGEYTLLTDMDDEPDTITISTDLFSAYAIAYEQVDTQETDTEGPKCGLCHVCPTFLGICCFIWLAIILAAFLIIWIAIRRNRKEKEEQKE